jgi:hypothetical protein
VREQELS